jgi:hypothetical protein
LIIWQKIEKAKSEFAKENFENVAKNIFNGRPIEKCIIDTNAENQLS